jgi:23S rRNA (adenine2503-C2)-methyltransferase
MVLATGGFLSNADTLGCAGSSGEIQPATTGEAHAKIRPSLQRNFVPLQLLGKSVEELRALAASWGEPAYRGDQIYHALYAERIFDFAQMTTLSANLREQLANEAEIRIPKIVKRYHSSDGSVRYLLALDGDDTKTAAPVNVEAVFMPDAKDDARRQTICISTQAGCAVDCKFCLTALLGLNRNLSAGEIVGQVLVALNDQREHLLPQTNVVLMGQGEPLLNYDAVITAVRILLDQRGVCLAPKHVTLSTSGIVPGIERLAQEKMRPKLAISLNASNDKQRDAIMPINRKYPLAVLLDACRNYPLGPREWITFEYVMLGGFNDAPEDARRVAKLLANIPSKVNLIPWNPGELPYKRPTQESIDAFKQILLDKGVFAFVRISRGQDIMAACGQLALIESSEIRAAV